MAPSLGGRGDEADYQKDAGLCRVRVGVASPVLVSLFASRRRYDLHKVRLLSATLDIDWFSWHRVTGGVSGGVGVAVSLGYHKSEPRPLARSPARADLPRVARIVEGCTPICSSTLRLRAWVTVWSEKYR